MKDEAEQERMWEDQHEWAADKLYSLCTELGGFFLKVRNILYDCSRETLGNPFCICMVQWTAAVGPEENQRQTSITCHFTSLLYVHGRLYMLCYFCIAFLLYIFF